jgi:hypothetical protein
MFGDDFTSQSMAHVDDRLHDGRAAPLLADVLDEGASIFSRLTGIDRKWVSEA